MSRDSSSSELRSVGTDSYAPTLLQAEMELFKGAPSEIWQGIKNRGQQMLDNKALTAVEIVGSGAIGATIALASRNPGALGTVARFAPKDLGALAVADVSSRVAGPMFEAGRSGGNVELARKQLGANLGSALIDYPLMAMSGMAGAKLAPRVKFPALDVQTGPKLAFENPPLFSNTKPALRIDSPNAFHGKGDSGMVYGTGDGRLFASTQPKLRLSHELSGHDMSGFKYDWSKGGLNEMLSNRLGEQFAQSLVTTKSSLVPAAVASTSVAAFRGFAGSDPRPVQNVATEVESSNTDLVWKPNLKPDWSTDYFQPTYKGHLKDNRAETP